MHSLFFFWQNVKSRVSRIFLTQVMRLRSLMLMFFLCNNHIFYINLNVYSPLILPKSLKNWKGGPWKFQPELRGSSKISTRNGFFENLDENKFKPELGGVFENLDAKKGGLEKISMRKGPWKFWPKKGVFGNFDRKKGGGSLKMPPPQFCQGATLRYIQTGCHVSNLFCSTGTIWFCFTKTAVTPLKIDHFYPNFAQK